MTRPLFLLIMAASAAFSQYRVEPAGPPPAELGSAIGATLQKDGDRIVGPNGLICEIWFRSTAPSGPKSTQDSIALPTIPQGAMVGALRFPSAGADRRGQTIKPGVYTLRYSLHPVNGDHQGVAPQRDFLLMSPADIDNAPNSTPDFATLANMSRQASGTPHPAVLSLSTSSNGTFPDLKMEGEHDWVLHAKLGETAIALIVVGRGE